MRKFVEKQNSPHVVKRQSALPAKCRPFDLNEEEKRQPVADFKILKLLTHSYVRRFC